MYKYLFFFLFLFLSHGLNAQKKEKTWEISGGPIDAYTQKGVVGGTKATLLRMDSTVVDTMVCVDFTRELMTNENSSYFEFNVDGKINQFILRLSHPYYKTAYYPLKLKLYKGKRDIWLGDFKMTRLSRRDQAILLDEVEIETTQVKFYSKGDTLVYNADAFQLAEGSMLDALIEQLPGVELKEDGRIYVNGKFVESLLLNGKDFFKGDNTIMLNNLPGYMVKEVKVYTEDSKTSKLLERKVDEGRYVMDVNLKRQYSIGWIGNTEWGAGTDNRYIGRLFALRFTPQSSLYIFANMNNINDRAQPGRRGDWNTDLIADALHATKNIGINYDVVDKGGNFFFYGETRASRTDDDNRSNSTGVNFLPGGDTYGRAWRSSQGWNTNLYTMHRVYFESKFINMNISPRLSYSNYSNGSSSISATFSNDPFSYSSILDSLSLPDAGASLRRILMNRNRQQSIGDGHNLNGTLYVHSFVRLPFSGKGMDITGEITHSDSKNERFNHYLLDFPSSEASTTDFRNRYYQTGDKGYDYNLRVKYYGNIGKIDFNPEYK